jgi:hypothetical protein
MIYHGGNQFTYDIFNETLGTMTSSHTFLTGNMQYGGHSFYIDSGTNAGKWMIVHGNASSTSLYDEATESISPGPSLGGNANYGSNEFKIETRTNTGKWLIVHGNSMATSLYDPSNNTMVTGPASTANFYSRRQRFSNNQRPASRPMDDDLRKQHHKYIYV